MSKQNYSWLNPRPAKHSYKGSKSIVVPDQTMSVRTIMDRYNRGMPLSQTIKKPEYYNGEFPDIQGMDLSEIAELKRHAKAQVDKLQDTLNKQEAYKKYQEQKTLTDQIEALKKQIEDNGNQGRAKVPL